MDAHIDPTPRSDKPRSDKPRRRCIRPVVLGSVLLLAGLMASCGRAAGGDPASSDTMAAPMASTTTAPSTTTSTLAEPITQPPDVVPATITVTTPSGVLAQFDLPDAPGPPWSCQFLAAAVQGGMGGGVGFWIDRDAGPIDPETGQMVAFRCVDDFERQVFLNLDYYDPGRPLHALAITGLEPDQP